jgi:transposase InsO family protein
MGSCRAASASCEQAGAPRIQAARRRGADITYVAINEGFAYVAVILDAWSRRAVGYAISRSIDVRLTLAAPNAAIERRKPPPGCETEVRNMLRRAIGEPCSATILSVRRVDAGTAMTTQRPKAS